MVFSTSANYVDISMQCTDAHIVAAQVIWGIWLRASGMQFIHVTIFHRLLFHVGGTKFQCSHKEKDSKFWYMKLLRAITESPTNDIKRKRGEREKKKWQIQIVSCTQTIAQFHRFEFCLQLKARTALPDLRRRHQDSNERCDKRNA